MEEFTSVVPGYSDSTSPISEPQDITNWFSNYVYESFPLCSLVKESESELNGVSFGEDTENRRVTVPESRSLEKFVSNKVHKLNMKKQISDLYESPPSEPPDIGNWFSSYVYESPMLESSDSLQLSIPGESECVKQTQREEDTTQIGRINVCPKFIEQELVSPAKVTDSPQSQSVLSEPSDVRNWFASYEYQSPQLSDTHELEFFSFEKDQLVIDESDTEGENSSGIFRKTKSKQETITSSGKLKSNDCKETIAADTANEVYADNAYSDHEMEKKSSVGLFNASKKEVKQESSFKQEQVFCEPRCSPGVSQNNPKPQFSSKKEASLHELRLQHIQETISKSSSRRKSPRKATQKAYLEENLESIDQGSDDKENVHVKSNETGFVTMKKERFRESRDQCSMTKPNRGVMVECSRSKELKKIGKEEDVEKEEEEERKKKRKVLGEMANLQFSGDEETTGKWCCPQKNKGKAGPPLKQLRLDAWIHKV